MHVVLGHAGCGRQKLHPGIFPVFQWCHGHVAWKIKAIKGAVQKSCGAWLDPIERSVPVHNGPWPFTTPRLAVRQLRH